MGRALKAVGFRSSYFGALKIIHRALRGEPITNYRDGRQTRDFIYVKDLVASATFFALEFEATGLFNVAKGTILELTRKIIWAANSKGGIRYQARRFGDVRHLIPNVSRAPTTGFQLWGNLEISLQETIHCLKMQATFVR